MFGWPDFNPSARRQLHAYICYKFFLGAKVYGLPPLPIQSLNPNIYLFYMCPEPGLHKRNVQQTSTLVNIW